MWIATVGEMKQITRTALQAAAAGMCLAGTNGLGGDPSCRMMANVSIDPAMDHELSFSPAGQWRGGGIRPD